MTNRSKLCWTRSPSKSKKCHTRTRKVPYHRMKCRMKSDEYRRMHELESQFWWYQALRSRLMRDARRMLADASDSLILDAGCGTGSNALALGELGNVVALDVSAVAIDYCQGRKLPR